MKRFTVVVTAMVFLVVASLASPAVAGWYRTWDGCRYNWAWRADPNYTTNHNATTNASHTFEDHSVTLNSTIIYEQVPAETGTTLAAYVAGRSYANRDLGVPIHALISAGKEIAYQGSKVVGDGGQLISQLAEQDAATERLRIKADALSQPDAVTSGKGASIQRQYNITNEGGGSDRGGAGTVRALGGSTGADGILKTRCVDCHKTGNEANGFNFQTRNAADFTPDEVVKILNYIDTGKCPKGSKLSAREKQTLAAGLPAAAE